MQSYHFGFKVPDLAKLRKHSRQSLNFVTMLFAGSVTCSMMQMAYKVKSSKLKVMTSAYGIGCPSVGRIHHQFIICSLHVYAGCVRLCRVEGNTVLSHMVMTLRGCEISINSYTYLYLYGLPFTCTHYSSTPVSYFAVLFLGQ